MCTQQHLHTQRRRRRTGGCGGASPVDIRLAVDDLISGLDKPWDIAWLPNGTFLVTERPGRLNVYVEGTDEAPVVIPLPDVVAGGEGGVMGLEVDPAFASGSPNGEEPQLLTGARVERMRDRQSLR